MKRELYRDSFKVRVEALLPGLGKVAVIWVTGPAVVAGGRLGGLLLPLVTGLLGQSRLDKGKSALKRLGDANWVGSKQVSMQNYR